MRRFAATAVNDQGVTFRFTFPSDNWAGIEQLASARLRDIVEGDVLHLKNGPCAQPISTSPDRTDDTRDWISRRSVATPTDRNSYLGPLLMGGLLTRCDLPAGRC